METRSLKRKREQEDERVRFNFSLGCALLFNRDVLNSVLEHLNVICICRLRKLSKGWNEFISGDKARIRLGKFRVDILVLSSGHYEQKEILNIPLTSFHTWGNQHSSTLFIQCPTMDHITREPFRGKILSFFHHPVIQNNLSELTIESRNDASPIFDLLSSSDLVIPKKLLRLKLTLLWFLSVENVKPFVEKFKDVEVRLGVMSKGGLKETIRELESVIGGCANASVGRWHSII
jgi:hypothetical protein